MVLERINWIALALAAALLALGGAAGVWGPPRDASAFVHLRELIDLWRLVILSLAAIPLLSWSGFGSLRLLRKRRVLWGGLASSAWLIVTANLLFWGLVAADFPPVEGLYKKGRVVWVGERAFIFAHGYWKMSDGYWQHQTIVRMPGGKIYHGPTLRLLVWLRKKGAATVWGSWCYTGNYPYIRKDLINGSRVQWPSFASYNKMPGLTIPVWLGSAVVRLWWPKERFLAEPDPIRPPVAPDTLYIMDPSAHRIEQAFSLMQQRVPGLPRPDSVSWQPLLPDTVHAISEAALEQLAPEEREEVLEQERAALRDNARTGLALYWIRGRAFPVSVRVPARLSRAPGPEEVDRQIAASSR